MSNRKSYSELIKLKTFEERFKYLAIGGKVGQETFGDERIYNQMFYTSPEWRRFRNEIITRDNGCDLGVPGYDIVQIRKNKSDRESYVFVHHINPISIKDLQIGGEHLFDPENFITCSFRTHQAIHYGDLSLLLPVIPNIRKPNDTCPWKQ